MTDIDWTNEEARNAYIQEQIKTAVDTEVAGLKKTNQALKEEKVEVKQKLTAEQQKMMDDYNRLKEQERKAEEDRLKAAGEFETLKEKLEAEYKQQLQSKDEYVNKLKNARKQELMEASLKAAINEAQGNELFLKPHLQNRISVKELDNGDFKVVPLSSDGNELMVNGEYASLTDLVNEFKSNESFAGAFKGTGVSGTGSKSTTAPTTAPTKSWAEMSYAEQVELYNTNKDLALQLQKNG